MGIGHGGSSGNAEMTKIIVLYIYCYTHRSLVDVITSVTILNLLKYVRIG